MQHFNPADHTTWPKPGEFVYGYNKSYFGGECKFFGKFDPKYTRIGFVNLDPDDTYWWRADEERIGFMHPKSKTCIKINSSAIKRASTNSDVFADLHVLKKARLIASQISFGIILLSFLVLLVAVVIFLI